MRDKLPVMWLIISLLDVLADGCALELFVSLSITHDFVLTIVTSRDSSRLVTTY